MELGIREAEDDCQDRGTDIAEEDGPEARNVPVAVATNDIVEIAAELIALSWLAGLLTYEVKGRAYRVECQVPKSTEKRIPAPKVGCFDAWG